MASIRKLIRVVRNRVREELELLIGTVFLYVVTKCSGIIMAMIAQHREYINIYIPTHTLVCFILYELYLNVK